MKSMADWPGFSPGKPNTVRSGVGEGVMLGVGAGVCVGGGALITVAVADASTEAVELLPPLINRFALCKLQPDRINPPKINIARYFRIFIRARCDV